MVYAFRIRPLARLVLVAALLLTAFNFWRLAVQMHSLMALILALICLFFAVVALRGLLRMLRAYGRTWVG